MHLYHHFLVMYMTHLYLVGSLHIQFYFLSLKWKIGLFSYITCIGVFYVMHINARVLYTHWCIHSILCTPVKKPPQKSSSTSFRLQPPLYRENIIFLVVRFRKNLRYKVFSL